VYFSTKRSFFDHLIHKNDCLIEHQFIIFSPALSFSAAITITF